MPRKDLSKNKNGEYVYFIFLRYVIILVIGLGNLFVFYFIFTPPTLYLSYYILKLFFDVSLSGIIISLGEKGVEIVKACVAGAAYYLLFMLNLGIAMNWKKRILSITYSFLVLFFLNVVRIVILSSLFFTNSSAFDITHKLTWYGLSIVFVVLIWFSSVHIFKIKQIPFYDDVKYLYNIVKKSKR
ncbi:MAG: pacearchaeosortase [Nanoarchaeota archaeon]